MIAASLSPNVTIANEHFSTPCGKNRDYMLRLLCVFYFFLLSISGFLLEISNLHSKTSFHSSFLYTYICVYKAHGSNVAVRLVRFRIMYTLQERPLWLQE